MKTYRTSIKIKFKIQIIQYFKAIKNYNNNLRKKKKKMINMIKPLIETQIMT